MVLLLARAQPALPAEPPPLVAVFPLQDLRSGSERAWLGVFLQTALREALLRARRTAVLPKRTAVQWQAALGLQPGLPVSAEHLRRMGADFAVGGTTQSVLQLIRVRLAVSGRDPSFAGAAPFELNFVRGNILPSAMADEVARNVFARVLPGVDPAPAVAPQDWRTVEEFYGLAPFPDEELPAGAAAPEALARMAAVPALAGKARAALALHALHEALAPRADDASRARQLDAALRHIRAAVAAEPWNGDWKALHGEIRIFRKEFAQAKAEGGAARLSNAGSPLPHIVLAMEAGLSTGMGRELMLRATALDPFMGLERPPEGVAVYQGGVLEDTFASWRKLVAGSSLPARAEYQQQLDKGIAFFQAQRWAEAQDVLEAASQSDASDYRPGLYLARILILTDHAADAVPRLKVLAAENPLEPDVQYYYGLALTRTQMYADAAEAFGHVLEEEPDHRDALLNLAEVEMAQQHWERARGPLRRLLLHNPTHEQAWLRLGVVYTRLQQWNDARAALQQAKALNPQAPEADELLARMEAERRALDKLAAPEPSGTGPTARDNASASGGSTSAAGTVEGSASQDSGGSTSAAGTVEGSASQDSGGSTAEPGNPSTPAPTDSGSD